MQQLGRCSRVDDFDQQQALLLCALNDIYNSMNGSYITGFYFLPPRMGKEMTLQEILTRSTLPASDVFNLDFFYKGAKFDMAFSTEHELSSTRLG